MRFILIYPTVKKEYLVSVLSLSSLKPGEQAIVRAYRPGHRAYRERLLAMGLTPNTTLTLVRRAPLGDPIQICVRQCALSLRCAEAAIVLVERTP